MPAYKLIYFNARGRAELCRLLFALAGQDFEDVRLDKAKWQEIKSTTIGEQLPVLEIDGKQFCQSLAMANYLAREFGYYGQTNFEAFQIEEINGFIEDLRRHVIKVMFAAESEKEAAAKAFKETQSPPLLKALERRLKENNTNYFVGSSVTLADVAVYDFFSFLGNRFPDLLDNFPELKAHEERIGNLDKIKEHVAKREPTPF